jgi:hypothetical protein
MKSKTFQISLCFILFVLCSIAIIGCANMDTKTSTGITLKATKDVFVETARTAKRLIDSGLISEADGYAIKDAYEDGRVLLRQAHEIWSRMVAVDSFVNMRDYENALIEVARMSAVIENIIREYD